jgi:hypothetical protein
VLSILFTLAIVAAVVATGARRWRRRRAWAAARALPGANADHPIPIRSYTDIDDALRERWCPTCGGYLERAGEGTRTVDGKPLRVARLVCQECEEAVEFFFDSSDLLH